MRKHSVFKRRTKYIIILWYDEIEMFPHVNRVSFSGEKNLFRKYADDIIL